jgi:hypothetical protein
VHDQTVAPLLELDELDELDVLVEHAGSRYIAELHPVSVWYAMFSKPFCSVGSSSVTVDPSGMTSRMLNVVPGPLRRLRSAVVTSVVHAGGAPLELLLAPPEPLALLLLDVLPTDVLLSTLLLFAPPAPPVLPVLPVLLLDGPTLLLALLPPLDAPVAEPEEHAGSERTTAPSVTATRDRADGRREVMDAQDSGWRTAPKRRELPPLPASG